MNAVPEILADGHDALMSSFSASYAGVVAFIAVATEGSFARAGDPKGFSLVGRRLTCEAKAGGVDEAEGYAADGCRFFDGVARGSGQRRNDGALAVQQTVEE